MPHSGRTRPAPLDQADGLRRRFAGPRPRVVALAANPSATFGGVAIERLTAAFGRRHLHTLIVDATDWAPAAAEVSALDLGSGIETLSDEVSYLAARGLPMRHTDARGGTGGFLVQVAEAAPHADVVLVHAAASDLARLFQRRPVRPVLVCAANGDAVTQAYGALKLLALRNGTAAFDVLLAAQPGAARTTAVVQRLAECADEFLGASLGCWAAVDAASHPDDPLPDELEALAAAVLAADDPADGSPWTAAAPMPAAAPDAPAWAQ